MPPKAQIFFVSSDRALLKDIGSAHRGGEFDICAFATAAQATAAMGVAPVDAGKASGLVLDLAEVGGAERDGLLEFGRSRAGCLTFLVKPLIPLSPLQPYPLRVVYWPLPPGFVEQTAVVSRPVVFLAETQLFKTKALTQCFAPTDIQPVVLQSTEGLAEYLMQSPKPIAAEKEKPQGLLSRIGELSFWESPQPIFAKKPSGGEGAAPSGGFVLPLLSHVVMAPCGGGQREAEELDGRIREKVPEAVCYYITNADPLLEAAQASRARAPIALLRHHVIHIPSILESCQSKSLPQHKTPILLMDNDIESLTGLAQALLAVGYQVDIAKDQKEAIGLFNARGKYHVVVVGLTFSYSFSYGAGVGQEMARALSRLDPDARFVYLVDLYPLERAVREMSKAIELGADDALVKPVAAARLLQAVERALQRRRIYLDNARVHREGTALPVIHDPDSVTLVAGRYDLVFQIGEGGMGLVFLASDRQLGRMVALKRMRPEIKANPVHRERFMQEARIISKLNHPYIVGIHEIVDHHGEIYLVLDYVDGKALSKILEEKKKLTLHEARDIFFQICQAIDAAHRGHVLHRDLKPSNIMIDVHGYAKVMDFGLARETKETVTLMTQQDVGGTLAYMAPEQHLGHSGPPSDIFSLGVCLYEVLTGVLPFLGPDYLAQKERRLYTPATQLTAGLPPSLDVLIASSLDPDPRTRIQTAMGLFGTLSKVEEAH